MGNPPTTGVGKKAKKSPQHRTGGYIKRQKNPPSTGLGAI